MTEIKTVNGYKLTTAISTFWNMLNRTSVDETKITKNLNLWSIELILTDKNFYFETVYLFYFTYIVKVDHNFIFNIMKIENQYDQYGLSNDIMIYMFYVNEYIYNAMEYYCMIDNVEVQKFTEYNSIDEKKYYLVNEIDIFSDLTNADDIEYIINYFTQSIIDPNYKNYNIMWKLLKLMMDNNLFTLFNSFRKKYHPSIYNRTDLYYQITYGLLFLCKNNMYFPSSEIIVDDINQRECWSMFDLMNKKYLLKLEAEISKKLTEQHNDTTNRSLKNPSYSSTKNKTRSKNKFSTKIDSNAISKIEEKKEKYVSALYADLRDGME